MKYLFILPLLLFLLPLFSVAQDIHFSQFNENSSLVNPALTGQAFAIRASAIYKDQWRSVTVPYQTFGAAYEMRFNASNWDKVDEHMTETFKKTFSRMAAGLSFYNDKAGDGKMGISQTNLSLASFVPLSKSSTLSLGLQGSIVQRKIDYSKLIWPDQYTASGYNTSLDPGESFAAGNFIYPDFATGILWSYGYNETAISANNQFKVDLGFSMFHLNKPAQKYLASTSEKLYSKYVFHGKSLIGIKNSNFSLVPSFIFQMQGSSKELIVGTLFRYMFKEDSKYTGFEKSSYFSFGAFYRNKDALIATVLLEKGQFALGFSYDVNTSGLTAASSSRGGFEVCLRFNTANPFLYQNKTDAKFD